MDSMISTNYKIKGVCSVIRDDFACDDSGWSLYIEDSVISINVEDVAVPSGSEFSSLLSDAASLAKKVYTQDGQSTSTWSFTKRRKTEVSCIDHDLEDTASSPVCNSKVYDLEEIYSKSQWRSFDLNKFNNMEQLNEHGNSAASQETGNSVDQTNEVMHSDFIGNGICYKGLRERGLCLVPVSMLFKF